MNFKYYLRGLGIGVLITAFIIGITGKDESMTDAEIKVRAAQLGMVEETVLADLKTSEASEEESENESAFTEEESIEAASQDIAVKEESGAEEVDSQAEEIDEESDSEEISSQNEAANKQSALASSEKTVVGANGLVTTEVSVTEENYVIVTIETGNNCTAVSQKLFEAGMVESSEEYTKYLISNGYDRKLRAGEHRIPVGSSEEQIARIICKID